ncbi:unnamed protein product [Symbiodinium microadriaticum]|nr:unnamed protein product [Symbiodinium microadriaticum]
MSAHDSVIPESPPILENLQDGRETSKCMSPGPARGRSSLRLWFQSRLHQIEQEGDRATGCPLWIFRRPPHACHSSACSFLFLMMAYALFLHGSAVQEISLEYGPDDLWKEIVVEEGLAGASLISYELLRFNANNRHYQESRPLAFNLLVAQYSCTGITQVADVLPRRSPDPAFHQLLEGFDQFRPCGLVSMSVFTDQFRLEDSQGLAMQVDETELCLPADGDLYSWISMDANSGRFQVEGITSWIPDGTFLEHLKVWYRTPAAPRVRQLWGRIPGGLSPGRYNLSFPVNSPLWREWGIEKRVVFSQLSGFGMGSPGACFTLAVLCCAVASVDLLVALALLLAGEAFSRKRRTVHPE